MSSLSKAGLAVVIFAAIIWVGCNEAFRPIVIPNPSPGPDPQHLLNAYVLSNNCGATCPLPPGSGIGAVTTIDVSGDTVSAIQYGGHGPVDLFLGSLLFMVNQVDETLTGLTIGNPSATPVTIPLPAGAQPVFAGGGGTLYVAESGRNRVAAISSSTFSLLTEILVGGNPVAIAQAANGQKIYVVNQADGTVTVIRVTDNGVLGTIPVGTSPVAAVASSDGQFVFVANEGSNSVTVIDTTNDATALGTIVLGVATSPGCAGQIPCFSITYDPGLKRVYTANRASNTVSIIRADQPSPTMPTLLTPDPGIDVTAAPCSGASPRQVAVLPDGSRAYVVNHDSGNVCVLSSLSNTFTKSIALPLGAVPTSVAAAFSGTKVYTANPGTKNISILATTSDTLITSLPSPKTDPNCQDPAPPAPPICSHMNPVYVTAP